MRPTTCLLLVFCALAVPGPKDIVTEELVLAPPPKMISDDIKHDDHEVHEPTPEKHDAVPAVTAEQHDHVSSTDQHEHVGSTEQHEHGNSTEQHEHGNSTEQHEHTAMEQHGNITESDVARNAFPLYIRFLGWPQAVTSETAHLIVEGMDPGKLPSTTLGTKQGSTNAQILYEKVKQSDAAPLVSVLLMEDQREVMTMYKDRFDMVSQQCSCYWIDIKDVASQVPHLPASDKYYLRFLDTLNTPPRFDARSGYFAISP